MIDRRQFMVTLGVITTVIGYSGCRPAAEAGQQQRETGAAMKTAGFGWEIARLNDCGADAYFPIKNNMIIHSIDVDVAFMLTALPSGPGMAEVLSTAFISRGGPPDFQTGVHAYPPENLSPDFGSLQFCDPNHLSPNCSNPSQDILCAVILKGFASASGLGASMSRHVGTLPNATVSAGDYLAFHMDHYGVPGDGEMQVVIGYELI